MTPGDRGFTLVELVVVGVESLVQAEAGIQNDCGDDCGGGKSNFLEDLGKCHICITEAMILVVMDPVVRGN